MTQNPCHGDERQISKEIFSRDLVHRVNELYHDFQADDFNELHRMRHLVERLFWASNVVPVLLRDGAAFGVDLCSGTGFVPRVLMKNMPSDTTMLCIDLSGEALLRGKSSLGPAGQQITYHVGDVTRIPLENGKADWVSLNAGLHHLPDPSSVLREIDRVLKRGGVFCMGHEPNAAFFRSPSLYKMERFIWNLFWYCSLPRNIKRIKRKLGRRVDDYEHHEHLDAINNKLITEGLIDKPLTLAELRRMVDIHTALENDAEKSHKGFWVHELIEKNFPEYVIEFIRYVDYGGEMLRRHPRLRSAFDTLMRWLAPDKGRLFSWILRKPDS